MNPLAGLIAMADSKKGYAFILATGVLLYLHSSGAHWWCEVCATALGVAYIIAQAWVDAATARKP